MHRKEKTNLSPAIKILPFLFFVMTLNLPIPGTVSADTPTISPAEDLFDRLTREASRETEEKPPSEEIFSRNDILFCTGTSPAALANNRAAGLMEKGNYEEAALILESGLLRASLFLPFRYNLGLCRIHLQQNEEALIHLNKAVQLLPEYSKTYLIIGFVHERTGRDGQAMQYYKMALRQNPRELDAYIRTGDIYYGRKQLDMAARFYERGLAHNPRYPNGLLGRAKIHFERGEYFKAIVQIQSIDTSGEYDKSLHYYHAESAYRLRDYQTAFEQYQELLKHGGDRFFLTTSTFIIKHKMEMSRRFIER